MGEEVHARGRRTADRMRIPGAARRERSHRAARGSKEALRTGRLEAQTHQNFHRRGRRRRALPGRSPPARRRLHRRLAAREHVSGIFLTRVTRIFQDPLFTKFVPASSRQRVAAAARSAARSSAPVISLLRPCYCLFFSCRRSDFLLIFLALRAPRLFFLLLFTGKCILG